MKSLSLSLLAALALVPSLAQADPVFWVDWTTTTATGVEGTLTVGDAIITATYAGQYYATTQVDGAGEDFWVPAAPYLSPSVDNRPTGTDIVTISEAGPRSITFSKPIRNPIFSVVSLNGNGYEFDTDFVILSMGEGFFGNGTLSKTDLGDGHFRLDGTAGEPHGTIEFQGIVSQINWTAGSEIWNGFSMAARGVSCLGHKGTPDLASGEECTLSSLPVCRADGLCVEPAANGAPIPANPNALAPYLGACNAVDGALLCASAVCSVDDDLCGLPNGAVALGGDGLPTADAAVCRSGALDADGKCGLAEGVACTVDAQCRAEVCAADNLCGLVLGDTCIPNAANDPCRGALACDAISNVCDTDTDADGLTDTQEEDLGTDPALADTDGDGIVDGAEVGPNAIEPTDTDGDGIIDALDSDDDDDGIPTASEIAAAIASGLGDDVDDDGKKNWHDTDANGDGIPDTQQTGDGNGNGVPDYLDLPGVPEAGTPDGGSSGSGPGDAGRADASSGSSGSAGGSGAGGSGAGGSGAGGSGAGGSNDLGLDGLGGGGGCTVSPRGALDLGGLLGLGLAVGMLRRRTRRRR